MPLCIRARVFYDDYDYAVSLTVIIAAHNEEHRISETLISLAEQTRPADTIIVICDRCTDGTAAIAGSFGARVMHTTGNAYRKAGALNQALMTVLPELNDEDMILIMDADTALTSEFLASAEERLTKTVEPHHSFAVGAIFLAGSDCDTFSAKALQRNEYLRYAHDLNRRHGRAEVISGTAGLFPVHALREVSDSRGDKLPGGGYVYSLQSLTEDNELTIALKHLGYRSASPGGCTVHTEIMPTFATLYYQRLRWQRGALSTLREYGVTAITLPYLIRQILMYIGVLFAPFFITAATHAIYTVGRLPWSWLWFFLGLIVIVERIWTVRGGGVKSLTLAVFVVPEVLYDIFQHYVFLRAAFDGLTGSREHWDHIEADGSERTKIVAPQLFIACAVALTCLSAMLCIQLGIQWVVIGVVVASGIAHSALRATSLDPLVLIHGSYRS